MKSKVIFIGTESFFLGRKLSRLGEAMELDASQFQAALDDEVAILPESEFRKFFTDEETKLMATSGMRKRAPEELIGKWRDALKRLAELKNSEDSHEPKDEPKGQE